MNTTRYIRTCLGLAISSIALSPFLVLGEMTGPSQVSQLIVLYDYSSPDLRITAEEIVSAVNRPLKDPRSLEIVQRFGGPASARLLIVDRMDAGQRQMLKGDDPQEQLQRYVLLSFDDVAAAQSTLKNLKQDPSVLSVEENAFLEYFAIPNDPLSSPGVGEGYQWGYTALNMYAAWDKTKGHGYVGVIDNGVRWTTPHTDLKNVRIQFSNNFGLGTSIDEADYGQRVYNFAGHGSHVAGLVAGTTNNAIGTAGSCWNCSLMITKANAWNIQNNSPQPDIAAVANSMNYLANAGAQVINMSFGGQVPNCASNPTQALCTAISFASSRDVILVAAAGNTPNQPTNFPASDARVMAVGGIQFGNTIWNETLGTPPVNYGSSLLPYLGGDISQRGVVGPARNVYSSVYNGLDWSPAFRCGDGFPLPATSAGFGWCTGTSMAAPQIAGIAALLRSINPLLTQAQIRTYVTQYSSFAANPNQNWGMGLPNANTSAAAVLTTTNRLTPLFAFFGPYTKNYFYTTVPQMGAAAVIGTLRPFVNMAFNTYVTVGTPVNIYSSFPGAGSGQPRAQVWIFTTPSNPVSPSIPLVPLYRMSWKCGDSAEPVCANFPNHTDHTYTTDAAGISAYQSVGYKLDGTEGYIYPNTVPQPAGTTKLYRKYNATYDDHAIFPESELANMAAAGYTVDSGAAWIGWVYANTTGNRPSY